MAEDKLTNKEINKVYTMYLPCAVLCGKQSGWIYSQKKHYSDLSFYVENEHRISKLLLTDLKDITDEHAIEVKNLIGASNAVWEIDEYTTRDIANWLLEKQLYMYCHCFQYLISKGYAVPLWFGIDHPCNGKTAIELGIAIKKQLLQGG